MTSLHVFPPLYVGLARTVYIHRIWPYIWWCPCQKYRIYTVYIWFWPTLVIRSFECNTVNFHQLLKCWLLYSRAFGNDAHLSYLESCKTHLLGWKAQPSCSCAAVDWWRSNAMLWCDAFAVHKYLRLVRTPSLSLSLSLSIYIYIYIYINI